MADRDLVARLSRIAAGRSGIRLRLEPLDVEATGELVASILGRRDLSRSLAIHLHERTQGVPLLVEEMLRSLHDRVGASGFEGEWTATPVFGSATAETSVSARRLHTVPGRMLCQEGCASSLEHPEPVPSSGPLFHAVSLQPRALPASVARVSDVPPTDTTRGDAVEAEPLEAAELANASLATPVSANAAAATTLVSVRFGGCVPLQTSGGASRCPNAAA